MDWFSVAFDGAITHVVPRPLFEPLLVDMLGRGFPLEDFEKRYGLEYAKSLGGNPKQATEWAFDLGGGYLVGMPSETFVLDGLKIDVTCDHLGTVIGLIRAKEARHFADGQSYYKLRFWHHATVVTVDQRARLLDDLERRYVGAEEKAMAFVEKWKRSSRARDTTNHEFGCECDRCERVRAEAS